MDNRDIELFAQMAHERQVEMWNQIETDAALHPAEAPNGLKRRLAITMVVAFAVVVVATSLQLFL